MATGCEQLWLNVRGGLLLLNTVFVYLDDILTEYLEK